MALGQAMGRNVKHRMKSGKGPAPCSEPLGALGEFGACSPQNLNFLLNAPVDPPTTTNFEALLQTCGRLSGRLCCFFLPPRAEEEMMGASRVLEPRLWMLFSAAKVKSE